MAEFREFYVQPGASSNFLAGKCLWSAEAKSKVQHGQDVDTDISTNEFFFQREKLWSSNLVYTTNNIGNEALDSFEADEDLISETKRIKPLLIELDEYINDGHSERPIVINNILI